MIFDSHTHLNLAAFETDREELLKKYLSEDIFLINVGTCLETSQKAVELANKYSNCWASVGLHPAHTFPTIIDSREISSKFQIQNSKFIEPETFGEAYLELLDSPRAVAIGECGLDYSYLKNLDEDKQEQNKKLEEQEFRKQIKIAQQYHLPLILHLRNLYQEALSILKEENYEGKAVFHFFTGTLADLSQILQNPNFFLGFSGVITYDQKLDAVIKEVPLERLLIETDAPYVAPVPHRGQRNEPAYVVEVAKKIALLKNLSLRKVEQVTFENTLRFFDIKI